MLSHPRRRNPTVLLALLWPRWLRYFRPELDNTVAVAELAELGLAQPRLRAVVADSTADSIAVAAAAVLAVDRTAPSFRSAPGDDTWRSCSHQPKVPLRTVADVMVVVVVAVDVAAAAAAAGVDDGKPMMLRLLQLPLASVLPARCYAVAVDVVAPTILHDSWTLLNVLDCINWVLFNIF